MTKYLDKEKIINDIYNEYNYQVIDNIENGVYDIEPDKDYEFTNEELISIDWCYGMADSEFGPFDYNPDPREQKYLDLKAKLDKIMKHRGIKENA